MKNYFLIFMTTFLFTTCNQQKQITSYDTYPILEQENLWISYTKASTLFKIWSPTADSVTLRLYRTGNDSPPFLKQNLEKQDDGLWLKNIDGDLDGTYYTFQVKTGDKWLLETPGIYAQAVGVNGNRAMVLDLQKTNPVGWSRDTGPQLEYANDALIYELHIRDMTIHPKSGSSDPGSYLGLVEKGTKGPGNLATGIDHLKELGITHVHLLPAFDHYSIDETQLQKPQFNWGYDPKNYNVPEGSFSSDPFNAEVRIREFKQMIKAFHDNNIGVILDVVYNHTGKTAESNFNQEVPHYYYRHSEDGSYSDAAACGNETASERIMMQRFMLESVKYWMQEYHIDGFRFDLMGIHDIKTMNLLSDEIKKINGNALIYGEGWTAKDSPIPEEKRALKEHMEQLPEIAAFSDDLRDGLKGSVFEDSDRGFVSGAKEMQESVKFGIVGAIQHPEILYEKVNYSSAPWTSEPWQAINYVSCHDNHTLFDKLKISIPEATDVERIAMNKLANAVVLTAQGTPFLHSGSEMLRTKNGEHNSYNLPDSINQIDWSWKETNKPVFDYYKNLIALRKAHPAFRMKTAGDVVKNLHFKKSSDSLISYTIENNANGDVWKKILVIYNASKKSIPYKIEESWREAVHGDSFTLTSDKVQTGVIKIPPISMYIAYQE